MKIKTDTLVGVQLDWAVAKCEGLNIYIPAYATRPWLQVRDEFNRPVTCPKWSTDWAQGGPILEAEHIGFDWAGWGVWEAWDDKTMPAPRYKGPTPLIAALRCFVASRLGEEIDIPKELT